MKLRVILVTTLIGVAVFWGGCADLRNGLPAPTSPGVQAHEPSWVDTSSPGFHGNAIRKANWDMRSCRTCHGENYDGGTSGASCRECHTGIAGPENCATCHGSTNPAPPRDLSGNTATSARGVGAHQRHLLGNGSTSNVFVSCSTCHVVPGAVYDPGHVDTPGPAEVRLVGGITFADSTGVPGPPRYDPNALTCSNTYCHGNFSLRKASSPFDLWYTDSVMVGANRSVKWTGGSSEVACGTCHGLPPAGHVAAPLANCGICHDNIVNSSGAVVDKMKHMNGKINVFGQERNF